MNVTISYQDGRYRITDGGTKVCRRCNIPKPKSDFDLHHGKCRPCDKLHQQEYNSSRAELIKKQRADYYQANKQKIRDQQLEYYNTYLKSYEGKLRVKGYSTSSPSRRNREQMDAQNQRVKREVENLDDNYIKNLIIKQTGLTCADVTDDLIGLKRQIIIAKRKLKEIDNE